MTTEDRITATMESWDVTFPGVKFDKQGNMGIDFNFIPMRIEYPACEGDFVNDFSVEAILEAVRNYKKDDGNDQGKNNSIN